MVKGIAWGLLAASSLLLVGWEEAEVGQSSAKEAAAIHFGLKEAPTLFSGKVTQSIHTENYSYLELQSLEAGSKETIWVATNRVAYEKGTRLRFQKSDPMRDFHSKTLNRTFPEIYFLSDFEVAKADVEKPKG